MSGNRERSAPLPDETFAPAVDAVAPRKFDIWKKLLVGAEARATEAERRADLAEERERLTNVWVEKLEAQLAKLKERKQS